MMNLNNFLYELYVYAAHNKYSKVIVTAIKKDRLT